MITTRKKFMDTQPIPAVLTSIVVGFGIYYLFFKKPKNSIESKFQESSSLSLLSSIKKSPNAKNTKKPKPKNNRNFVERMINNDRTMVIFYGSQTGTGEEFAFRISQNARRYGIKSLVLNPDECDFEEITNMKKKLDLSKNITLIMCLATYGEGDPTDNALDLYRVRA